MYRNQSRRYLSKLSFIIFRIETKILYLDTLQGFEQSHQAGVWVDTSLFRGSYRWLNKLKKKQLSSKTIEASASESWSHVAYVTREINIAYGKKLARFPTYTKLRSLECFPDCHFYVELLIPRVLLVYKDQNITHNKKRPFPRRTSFLSPWNFRGWYTADQGSRASKP